MNLKKRILKLCLIAIIVFWGVAINPSSVKAQGAFPNIGLNFWAYFHGSELAEMSLSNQEGECHYTADTATPGQVDPFMTELLLLGSITGQAGNVSQITNLDGELTGVYGHFPGPCPGPPTGTVNVTEVANASTGEPGWVHWQTVKTPVEIPIPAEVPTGNFIPEEASNRSFQLFSSLPPQLSWIPITGIGVILLMLVLGAISLIFPGILFSIENQ